MHKKCIILIDINFRPDMINKNIYEKPDIDVVCALPVEGLLSASGTSPEFYGEGEDIIITY